MSKPKKLSPEEVEVMYEIFRSADKAMEADEERRYIERVLTEYGPTDENHDYWND